MRERVPYHDTHTQTYAYHPAPVTPARPAGWSGCNVGGMTKPTIEELRNRFTYHPPRTDEQRKAHESVSERTLDMSEWLVALLPEGRNLSICLTLMEDVRMRANAALACDDPERRVEVKS